MNTKFNVGDSVLVSGVVLTVLSKEKDSVEYKISIKDSMGGGSKMLWVTEDVISSKQEEETDETH